MPRSIVALTVVLILAATSGFASDEGTRHIVGDDTDLFFMNDRVFGTVSGHPLWAIYNCGSDIKGEMDVDGTYHAFDFKYSNEENEARIRGSFGSHSMRLGQIEKTDVGFVYQVFVDDREHEFSIRYERLEAGHLLNSIIEGRLGDGRKVELRVDGRLCPFATTGIILIAAGASLLG
jgi:hypothetical protein